MLGPWSPLPGGCWYDVSIPPPHMTELGCRSLWAGSMLGLTCTHLPHASQIPHAPPRFPITFTFPVHLS